MKKKLQETLHPFFLFMLLCISASSYSQIGSLDTTFDPDEGPDSQVNAAVPLPNGKIMIAGNFSEYNTVSRNGIARINADGSLDSSFNPGTGVPIVTGNSTFGISDLKVQADGKILIGGGFISYNDVAKNNMVRLNIDGSIDDSFSLDTRITRSIRSIVLQPDGKIIITGRVTILGSQKGVARLNSDGSLDESFSSYLSPSVINANEIYCALLLPDGKILIGGSCQTSTTTFLQLTKLNADGSKDATFTPLVYTSTSNPVSSGGAVMSLAMQSDGKILVGGGFLKMVGNVIKYNLIRLNADGTFDASLNTGSGFGVSIISKVQTILPQDDGKIIIAGAFNNYNGNSRKGLARINANGALDTSFSVGTGFTITAANTATWLPNGNLLVAGNFTTYNDITRNRIAKISTKTITVNSLSETGPFCAGASFSLNYTPVGAFNTGNVFTAQLSDASGNFSTPTAIGTFTSDVAGTINVTIPQNIPSGISYKIRIISTSPIVSGDIYATAVSINTTPVPVSLAQSFCTSATVSNLQVTLATNALKKWYATATSTEALLPTTALNAGNYYVTQTLNGCESERVEVAVTINTATIPDFTIPQNLCSGSNVPSLPLTSPNGISGTWSPTTISNTIGGNYVFTPTAGQCASPVTVTTIISTTLPPTGTATQDFSTGQTLANFTVAGTSIKWYDAPAGGNELPNTTIIVSGTIYYASQTINGCESPTRLQIIAGIDLDTDTFDTTSLRYYPNPVSQFLNVNYSEDIDTIEIYNLLGQNVLILNPENTKVKIDVSILNSGTYLMKIKSGNNSKTVKFIKK